jgi:hypothetical protein
LREALDRVDASYLLREELPLRIEETQALELSLKETNILIERRKVQRLREVYCISKERQYIIAEGTNSPRNDTSL